MAYISAALRHAVQSRAGGRCEYCRFPQILSFLAFEVEHVVAEKHGGPTAPDNLAWACPFCNRFKGSDLGSLDPETGRLTPFFNPRTQPWADHPSPTVRPLTPPPLGGLAPLVGRSPRLQSLDAGLDEHGRDLRGAHPPLRRAHVGRDLPQPLPRLAPKAHQPAHRPLWIRRSARPGATPWLEALRQLRRQLQRTERAVGCRVHRVRCVGAKRPAHVLN